MTLNQKRREYIIMSFYTIIFKFTFCPIKSKKQEECQLCFLAHAQNHNVTLHKDNRQIPLIYFEIMT